jgi:hypothetical protein
MVQYEILRLLKLYILSYTQPFSVRIFHLVSNDGRNAHDAMRAIPVPRFELKTCVLRVDSVHVLELGHPVFAVPSLPRDAVEDACALTDLL